MKAASATVRGRRYTSGMANALVLYPAHTALLSLDCQTGLVSIYAKPQEEFIERCSSVLQAARKAGIAVIHARVGFRPGLPEVTTRNRLFGSIKSSPQHQKLFEGTAGAVHPKLGPEPDDIVITKHRISAFPGTDLHMILRAREIDTIVLFGIATSGVVLSTLLEACDVDYRTVAIADCCADTDTDLHRVLIERLFPVRGEVTTAAEFVRAVRAE